MQTTKQQATSTSMASAFAASWKECLKDLKKLPNHSNPNDPLLEGALSKVLAFTGKPEPQLNQKAWQHLVESMQVCV